jgi:glycosyltransferase involved in cell wall biosynthesis
MVRRRIETKGLSKKGADVRVLLLTDDFEDGGAGRQLALVAEYLPAEWERRVFGLNGGPFAAVIRDSGVHVDIHPRRSRYDVAPVLPLWRLLRDWRPDVVHSWGWISSLAAGTTCRILGIPVVDGSVRSARLGLKGLVRRRPAILLSQAVVANSAAGLRAHRVNGRKGRVIYNAFDPRRLSACAEESRQPDSPFTVVMTGRMVRDKDFRTFIEVARSRAGAPDWLFLAVGRGIEREQLTREARDVVDCGTLRFVDADVEAVGVVSGADVGVLMTDPRYAAESCSNSIMEYMACGLPVICSRGGGNLELVTDGLSGFAIRPSDAQQLAERLEFLRDHPGERRRLGAAGRNRILNEFTIQRMIAQFTDLYSELSRAQVARAR